MIEVTEADRDIASAIGVCPIIYTPHEVRSGMRDHTPFVQAFATHRIEAAKAERDRLQQKIEALEAALRNIQALAKKRQAEGGPDGNLKAIEGFATKALESQP